MASLKFCRHVLGLATVGFLCLSVCVSAEPDAGVGAAEAGDTQGGDCQPKRLHHHWVDFSNQLQAGMAGKFRDDDIVISAPVKSGTTWTMNIVHQLRTGGDEKMQDILQDVPWLEFHETPYQTDEELYKRWDALPHWFPRAFKTHSAPPQLPYDPNVRYVVVMRDPRDSFASILPFMHKHTDELIKFWELPEPMIRGMMRPETVHPLFEKFGRKGKHFTDFLKSWWELKDNDNVLMLHYADMKKDHMGSIKKIHDFLGFSLTAEQLDKVAYLTSFEYMKANGVKFAMPKVSEHTGVKFLHEDGMVRHGGVGYSKGLPADLEEVFMKTVKEELTSEQAKWLLSGGVLPAAKTEL